MRHSSLRALSLTTAMVVSAGHAAAATSLKTSVGVREAAVGEGIRVEVSALSDDGDSPKNPQLTVPPGFSVEGPSVSTSQQISFTGGSFQHRRGITASWVIAGTRPGKFIVGPATVTVGQGVLRGETVQIEILPAGSAPQRPTPRRPGGFFDPFDPFSGFPKLPGFDDDDTDQRPLIDVPDEPPPEYVVPRAPDPIAFLRATVEPRDAVVGQEVRLRVYGYGSRGAWEEVSSSEPSRADFLSEAIVDNSFRQKRVVLTVDGTRFTAAKVRDIALFPLHAGTLTVGPMEMGFRGRGYPETRPLAGLIRQSEPVRVEVTEPPIAGRPPGYVLGDVGAFTLSAAVDPRKIDAGGAIAVTIRIEGTGNVPRHVKLPQGADLDWPDPATSDAVTPTEQGISGWRQLRYVLNVDLPGERDLGEVTLPYFDLARHRYEVARVALGKIEVTPGAAASAAPPVAAPARSSAPERQDLHDDLGNLVPRRTLAKIDEVKEPLTDRSLFWLLLAGGPLAVVALRGVGEAARRLRSRLSARATSRTAVARRALDEARACSGKKDAAGVAAAVERAVYVTIDERLDLKARAVLRSELPRELERAGAPAELATATAALLDECERLRFGGAASDGLDVVVSRAADVVGRMARAKPAQRREPSA